MYKTKKDVDKHVQAALSNLRPKERDMRGMTIAKLYFKINEYAKAEEYLLAYLSAKEDSDQAHKMLAQCYKHLKKTEKALQSYQRSLQLNPKQHDVLVEVCQLLLDDPSLNANNAKYWCELAESEKVTHDAVFSLRLKLIDKMGKDTQPLEEIIQKEIAARPDDVSMRISLLRNFVEQQRVQEAFKYAYDLELKQNESFSSSADWYKMVEHVLNNYEMAKDAKKDWDYWLLVLLSLERQVGITLSSNIGNLNDVVNVLFKFDQYLHSFAQVAAGKGLLHEQRELVTFCQEHYRGQLLLHMITLQFKRELLQNKNKWKETVRSVLPLLLLGFQIERPDGRQPWLKHCNERSKQLVHLWTCETAFRAAQLGRILLSLIVEKEISASELNCAWYSSDALISLLRQICADKQWRRNIFLLIFTNSEQKLKESTSLFMTSSKLKEPSYVLPNLATVEEYEEVAQQLHPQSFAHYVYLCLSNDNLADLRAHYFNSLNFSTQNLVFCGVDSLNQLDVDSFLYATTIQAKRQLEVERETYNNFNSGNRNALAKPKMLPYALISSHLCTEEQSNWWCAAYTVYKNLSNHSNELRTQLQIGIEAVRGVNGPKADLYIVFKLGQILLARAQGMVKAVEKAALEARVELLYKQGLAMLKKHQKNHLEPYGKYFKYANSNLASVELAINIAAEDAISYLSTRYFKKSLYEEFIEELDELQLPTATYMQAEAYRKLDEASCTPKKTKRIYFERRNEYLQKTQDLLKNNKDHQLNSLIAGEIQRLHQELNNIVYSRSSSSNKNQYNQHSNNQTFGPPPRDFLNNSSYNEDAEQEFYGESSAVLNRSHRETATTAAILAAAAAANVNAPHNLELENLVKQIATTLSFVKEEIVDNIKPEVLSMRKEMSSLKEKVSQLEDILKKTRIASETPSRDDTSQVLDDLCMIEDVLQNQLYQTQSGQPHPPPTQHFPNVFNGAPTTGGSTFMGSTQTTPLQQQGAHVQQQQHRFFSPMSAYNSSMFPANPNSLNYYTQQQQYMMPSQGPGVPPNSILGPRNSNFPLNIYTPQAAPFIDAAGGIGFNLPQLAASQLAAQATITQLLPPPPAQVPASVVGTVPNTSSTVMPTPTASAVVPSNITMPVVPSQPTSAAPSIFNKALNNQPVEKGPPANVVITSSDPLPKAALGNSLHTAAQQPTLSVTIPPHHIKPSLVQTPEVGVATSSAFPIGPSTTSTCTFSFNLSGNTVSAAPVNTSKIFNSMESSAAESAPAVPAISSTLFGSSTFSFKPQIAAAAAAAEKAKLEQSGGANVLNESSSTSDVNKSFGADSEPEYDPRPDFQPIIPLPDEVEVKTGEEDETVMFCYLAKLYRHVANEWKERGKGDLKILKNKEGNSRILMRREQTHKICANHKITPELKLIKPDKEDKSFIWAANDFADEELHLEKFFVRFKLPEIAKEFRTAFENAKKEAMELNEKQKLKNKSTDPPKTGFALSKSNTLNNFATSTPSSNKSEGPFGSVGLLAKPTTKTNVNVVATAPPVSGAATSIIQQPFFGSIPQTKDEPKKQTTAGQASADDSSKQATAATASPFANFTFGTVPFGADGSGAVKSTVSNAPTKSASPAFSIFGNLGKGNIPSSIFAGSGAGGDAGAMFGTPLAKPKASADKPTTSDADEDDYVPTAEFTPVIALPELIQTSTGEENEVVLFEHRAKLLRFEKETSEWKERGLGNIKLLQAKNDINQVRLLMRREQVLKLCCNQRLAKDTQFTYVKNLRTALTWAGQDFSEETLNTETLCLRFKTEEICQQFLEAVLKAQAAMCIQSKVIKIKPQMQQKDSNENPKEKAVSGGSETIATKGFGDAFKPKAGSWTCNACYVSNSADQLYCASCVSPKDDTVPKKESAALDLTKDNTTKFSFGFSGGGDAAAAPKGNTPAFMFGAVTQSPLAATLAKSSSGSSSKSSTASQQSVVANTPATNAPTVISSKTGFGEAFKPKPGSWTCQGCYVFNAPDVLYCSACEAPKDNTVPKKDNNAGVLSLTASSGAPKFNFGFNAAATTTAAAPPTIAIPNSFTFDANTGATKSERVKNLFGGNIAGTKNDAFTFTQPTATSTTLAAAAAEGQNPVGTTFNFSLAQKSEGTGKDAQATFAIDKKDFSFTLKPRSPGRGQRSPTKSTGGNGDDTGDDDYHEEEENNRDFTPVIPLPDKIIVKTGEENEECLYVHRAKLFRLVDNEWKDRGLGDVKILRHRETRKLRVVMRREQVLKICLNHSLNDDVGYKPKDDKSWLFIVHDFSEGESVLERFTLRFKNSEIAKEFIYAVKRALDGTAQPIDEVVSESEQPTASQSNTATLKPIDDENRLKAEKLLLTYDFLNANVKCSGCRGCNPDTYVFETPQSLDPFYKSADDGRPPLPMQQPALNLPSLGAVTKTANRILIKPANMSLSVFNTNGGGGADDGDTNIFSGHNQQSINTKPFALLTSPTVASTPGTASDVKFSFRAALNSTGTSESFSTPSSGGFVFGDGGKNKVFGQTSIFSGTADTNTTKSIFGGASSNSDTVNPIKSIFGGSSAGTDNTENSIFSNAPSNWTSKPISGGCLFGSSSTTTTATTTTNTTGSNEGTIFGNNSGNSVSMGGSVFGGAKVTFGAPPVIGTKLADSNKANSSEKTFFGSNNALSFADLSSAASNTISAHTTPRNTTSESSSLFSQSGESTLGKNSSIDSSIIVDTADKKETTTTGFSDLAAKATTDFSALAAGVDFASFAAKATGNGGGTAEAFQKSQGGFIGLTHQDAFQSFLKPKIADSSGQTNALLKENSNTLADDENNDESYDPHYEPIIPLPAEIVVTTGEEEETKLFGERATLYRWNSDTKEWKERGVGELKILLHPVKQTYRVLLRREQIHKCVLNHAIGADFSFSNMNNNPKSFIWGAMNYAESTSGEPERLAVRFKKQEIGDDFRKTLEECIDAAKKRQQN